MLILIAYATIIMATSFPPPSSAAPSPSSATVPPVRMAILGSGRLCREWLRLCLEHPHILVAGVFSQLEPSQHIRTIFPELHANILMQPLHALKNPTLDNQDYDVLVVCDNAKTIKEQLKTYREKEQKATKQKKTAQEIIVKTETKATLTLLQLLETQSQQSEPQSLEQLQYLLQNLQIINLEPASSQTISRLSPFQQIIYNETIGSKSIDDDAVQNKIKLALPEQQAANLYATPYLQTLDSIVYSAVLILQPLIWHALAARGDIHIEVQLPSSTTKAEIEAQIPRQLEQLQQLIARPFIKLSLCYQNKLWLARAAQLQVHFILPDGYAQGDIMNAYRHSYATSPFIRLLPAQDAASPHAEARFVIGSNLFDIAFTLEPESGKVVVSAAFDLYGKGSLGTMMQAFNLSRGWAENTGLSTNAVYFESPPE